MGLSSDIWAHSITRPRKSEKNSAAKARKAASERRETEIGVEELTE
jgi:hypothetical protein